MIQAFIAIIQFKRGFGSEGGNENRPSLTHVRCALFQCAQCVDGMFYGSIWRMVSSLLADEKYDLFAVQGGIESVDDIDTVTSGSTSPNLGDMWR